MRLSAKIILSIFLLLLGSLSISGWISVQREKQVLNRLLEKQGRSISQAIAVSCIETLLSEDYPLLDTFLETTGREQDDVLSTEVIQKERIVSRYHSAHIGENKGKTFSSDIVFSPFEKETPLKLGKIILKLSDHENRLIVSDRIRELLFSTGVIFCFLIFTLLLMMRRIILQKVKKLDVHARSIGNGHLDSRIELHTKDELGQLASTMNRMTEKIQASLEKIKHQNEELKKLSAVKSEFLANMSHEIRTPMIGVLGMANILLATDLTKEQREYASIVRTSADSLLSIINDILDFSKIEAGKLDLEKAPFDLRHTLENILDSVAIQAREKELELICLVEPDVENSLLGD